MRSAQQKNPGRTLAGVNVPSPFRSRFPSLPDRREPILLPSGTNLAAYLVRITFSLGIETRGQLRPGETLLVFGGACGTGTAAIQLGRALGVRVIAVAGGKEKVAVCRRCGDVIYDTVGGELFDSALRCIANEGRLLAVGYASGAWHDAPTETLVRKDASVVGVFVGAYGKPFLEKVHGRLLARWRKVQSRVRSNARSPLRRSRAHGRKSDNAAPPERQSFESGTFEAAHTCWDSW